MDSDSDSEGNNKPKRKRGIDISCCPALGGFRKTSTLSSTTHSLRSPQPQRASRFQPDQDTIIEENEHQVHLSSSEIHMTKASAPNKSRDRDIVEQSKDYTGKDKLFTSPKVIGNFFMHK
mmetsp:Transcript_35490/g.41071  ORF Transcript_35490/g.41071 Transcript_35490/m.41071 type:complete len:120 (+) Transcript_35490:388-747(+)